MRKFLTLLLVLLGVEAAQAATVRYLSDALSSNCGGSYSIASDNCTGSDGDAYTAANIMAAISATAGGDTLKVRAGTYTTRINDNLGWFASTSASAIAVMEAYTGETVTITAVGQAAFNNSLQTSAYATFRNLNFSCTGAFAECMGLQGHHLRFETVTVTGNSSLTSISGVVVLINPAAHHNVFSGGRYHHPGADTLGGFFSPYGYPFYVSGDDNVVEYATVDSAEAYGIHNYCSSPCRADRNLYQFNNIHTVCFDLGTCAGILLGSGTGLVARGNVVRDLAGNGTVGGALMAVECGSSAIDCRVYNNTFADISHGGQLAAGFTWGNQTGGIVRNNIIYNTERNWYDSTGSGAGAITRSNNRCGSSTNTTGCSTTVDPGFTNAAANDFTLAAGSAMVDAGQSSIGSCTEPLNCSFTALGNGPLPDIGAFESIPFASASATTTSVLDITFGAAYAPLSTVSSCANVTVRQNGVTKTCSTFSNNGNATYRWTCAACLSAGGGTIDIAIAAGKFTDSIRIGGTLNQSNFALPVTPVTNNISGATEVFTSRHFRQRTWARQVTDTVAPAWLKSEDVVGTVRVNGGRFSVWWLIDCTVANCPSVGFLFEFNLNGGSWANVTDSCLTNAVCFDSTNSAAPHGTVIPAVQLTDSLGNYLAGAVAAQASSYPVLDLALNQSTQLQGNFAGKDGLVAGTDRICIRPKLDSGAAVTHSQTLCVDVVNPAGSPA